MNAPALDMLSMKGPMNTTLARSPSLNTPLYFRPSLLLSFLLLGTCSGKRDHSAHGMSRSSVILSPPSLPSTAAAPLAGQSEIPSTLSMSLPSSATRYASSGFPHTEAFWAMNGLTPWPNGARKKTPPSPPTSPSVLSLHPVGWCPTPSLRHE